MITEVEVSALDGSQGKNPFTLLVTLQPDRVQSQPGRGTLNIPATKGRPALASNFRVVVDGVDLSRVTKVDSFSIKQKVTQSSVGELRRFEPEQGIPEYDDLVLTMPEAYATSLDSWFQESVIRGSAKERDGRIEILDATLKAVLFTINLRGVGIWKMEMGEQVANTDRASNVIARFYVETATLEMK
ncbi:MAG: hypothetical protein QM758_00025 [Armatimonas sp.]